MEFFNSIDDQGRFLGVKVDLKAKSGQHNSHTVSYLYARKYLFDGGRFDLDVPTSELGNYKERPYKELSCGCSETQTLHCYEPDQKSYVCNVCGENN